MLFHCFSIRSSYEKFHEEIVKLKEIFKRNSYPEKFIDICMKILLNKLHVPKIVKHAAVKKKLFFFYTIDLHNDNINTKSLLN